MFIRSSHLFSFFHYVKRRLLSNFVFVLFIALCFSSLYLYGVAHVFYGDDYDVSVWYGVSSFIFSLVSVIAWFLFVGYRKLKGYPGYHVAFSVSVFLFISIVVSVFLVYLSIPIVVKSWDDRVSGYDSTLSIDRVAINYIDRLKEVHYNDKESIVKLVKNRISVIDNLDSYEDIAFVGFFHRAPTKTGYANQITSLWVVDRHDTNYRLHESIDFIIPVMAVIPGFSKSIVMDIIPINIRDGKRLWLSVWAIPRGKGSVSLVAKYIHGNDLSILQDLFNLDVSMAVLKDAPRLLEDFQLLVMFISVPMTLVVVFFSLILLRRFIRPIQKLVSATSLISKGIVGETIPPMEGVDREMANLVALFSQMSVDLKLKQDRLFQVERMAAWREVARRLAHEVKNPLTPIRLSIQRLVRQHQNQNPQFSQILTDSSATILRETDRLLVLVNEFSQFARFPKIRITSYDLLSFVCQAVKPVQLANPDFDISIIPENFKDPVKIGIDVDKMTQVVTNLVKNSVEAGSTKIGCYLSIDTASWTINVHDNGSGLSTQAQRRLFTPYFTTKSSGSGLGLVVSQKIIQEHRGTIDCVSEPGEGTTFRIRMPLWPEAVKQHPQDDDV